MTTTTLRNSLAHGVVQVKFTKADGSQRNMRATTKNDLIAVGDRHSESEKLMETADMPYNTVIKAWDTEKCAWRSIREDRVIDWHAVSN